MAQDPKTIRFNTQTDPNRLKRFEEAIKQAGADGGETIRNLTDAFCRYVEAHGHSPAWPVELTPIKPKNVVRMPKKKN